MMLQLHQGLVLSVLLYALPLLGLITSQTNLEAILRIALRICLGISRSATSIPTYTEAGANTIGNHLQKRALGHLIRITTCESGAPLLARIAETPESRLGQLLCVLGDVAGLSPPSHNCPHFTQTPTRWRSQSTLTEWAPVVKRLTSRPDSWHKSTWSSTVPGGRGYTAMAR